jgi:site-specific DNA recombinase
LKTRNGYRSVAHGDYKRRVVDEAEAVVVREIFERYAVGEAAKRIVRDLNVRGVPSPGSAWKNRVRRGAGWVNTTITGVHSKASGILRNPIYTGLHTWNKRKGRKVPGTSQRIQKRRPNKEWIEVRDDSLRIVSDDLWKRVQVRLEAHRWRVPAKGGRPARYVLSVVLKCASCGGSYVMANERNYRCSSHTNGRDILCTQRRVVHRKRTEARLLAGIKADLLAPDTLRAIVKGVQARRREIAQPHSGQYRDELARVDRELGNVVDALAKVGTSAALLARVRALEADRARLVAALHEGGKPPTIVPNVERVVRQRVELLEHMLAPVVDTSGRQLDDAVTEKGRAAVRELIGEERVVEDGEDVFAEVSYGRLVYNIGAQERT